MCSGTRQETEGRARWLGFPFLELNVGLVGIGTCRLTVDAVKQWIWERFLFNHNPTQVRTKATNSF